MTKRMFHGMSAVLVGVALTLVLMLFFLTTPHRGLAQSVSAVAADPVVGQPFTITTQTIDESAPAVAYDSMRREFLVVWHNERPYVDDDIYAQRVSLDGKLLSWFHVDYGAILAGDRNYPSVAYNSQRNDYLVVYSWYNAGNSNWDVLGRRVNLYGPQGSEFTIAVSTTISVGPEEGSPVVAYNSQDDEFMVVWVEDATYKEIWGQRVAGVAGGGTGGLELIGTKNQLVARPASGHCKSPDVAYHSVRNEYVLVYEYYVPGNPTQTEARRIAATGVYMPGQQVIINSEGEQPAVAANGDADQYVIVYKNMAGTGPPEIWGYQTSGDLSGFVHTALAQDLNNDMSDPDIARLGNSNLYQVVWLEQDAGRGVRGKRIDTDWNAGPPFDIYVVSGDYEQSPAVADGSTATLVVWEHDEVGTTGYDIYGRLLGYRVYLPLVLRNFQ